LDNDVVYKFFLTNYKSSVACVTHWFTGSLPFPPRATLAAGSLSGAGFLQFILGSAKSR